MQQSHISDKNVARLEKMAKSENPQVASLAAIVLKVAQVKPYKTRRLKFLAQTHPDLLRNLEETGLVLAHERDWETTEAPDQANSGETEILPEALLVYKKRVTSGFATTRSVLEFVRRQAR